MRVRRPERAPVETKGAPSRPASMAERWAQIDDLAGRFMERGHSNRHFEMPYDDNVNLA